MASNINPGNIDGTFPVAGQDNPSQGFRDNFTNIKNNFTFAQSEINDLQSKAILTGALTGSSLNNDMGGTALTRPQLVSWTESFLDLGGISSNAILDWNGGNFQRITTAAPISITFQNWPLSVGAGSFGYGVMRVWIAVTNIAHTVTLDAKVTIGVADIAGYNYANNTITFNKVGNYVFDFSSVDGGYNFLIQDVTRNRASFQDPSFYYDGTVSSALMIGYDTGLSSAITSDNGIYNVSSYGSYNSFGNAQIAGPLAGYTVTSARGNLLASSIQPVQTGDQLGYLNARTFTGNGAGNVMQQVASINFFAKGTQPVSGLGGNIAFFTADDGGSNPNVVKQALGIENDQSARFYGNVNVVGNLTVNGTVTGTTSIGHLANIGDVIVTSPVNGQLLVYSSSGSGGWINSNTAVAHIGNIGDVALTSTANGDFLRYNSATSQWVNLPYTGTSTTYTVTISDDGSTVPYNRNVFHLNGNPIRSNVGGVVTTNSVAFKAGNLYKFDISDSSNSTLGLAFSTTPDTSDPSSITPYTTGVTKVGTAGSAGAYITIQISDTTPSPLYFYGAATGVTNGTLLGGATPNYIVKSTLGEETVGGNLTVGGTLSVGNISIPGSLTVTSNVAVASGLQATAIGNVTPGSGAFTTILVGGLQAKAIGNVTSGSGAFTTLSASSTFSAGASTLGLTSATAINSTPIGNATPSTGSFTTLNASTLIVANNPPSTSSSSGTIGQIAWDSTHFYVCVATNTWVRASLSTF
jgi:hypothetical protein